MRGGGGVWDQEKHEVRMGARATWERRNSRGACACSYAGFLPFSSPLRKMAVSAHRMHPLVHQLFACADRGILGQNLNRSRSKCVYFLCIRRNNIAVQSSIFTTRTKRTTKIQEK